MKRTDLSYFEAAPAPRSDELCVQFARKVEPWYGFFVYAIVWGFGSMIAFTLGIVPAFLLADAIGQDAPAWATALGLAMGFAAFVGTWWLFARWVKRRRRATQPLLRDGVLIEGVVVDRFSAPAGEKVKRVALEFAASQLGGVKVYRLEVEHEGTRRRIEVPIAAGIRPASNTRLPVLFHPKAKYALVFDDTGKLQVATVTG